VLVGLPEWMRSRRGGAPLLVVAPHGGISDRDLLVPPSAPSRSNDLHTASLAEALAARLDASLLANAARDRNQLDLNRVDEVLARAPWFVEAIAEHVERILGRHEVAEVLFVHGWHIVQPKCDVGVGASLEPSRATALAEKLTVPPDYVASRLEPLREGCRRAGIASAYGERWPAAHRNNLMQVFRQVSSRPLPGAAARLAAWARSRRLAAAQLELGAPVRWPGAMRDAFVDAVAAAWRPTLPPPTCAAMPDDAAAAGAGYGAAMAPIRAEPAALQAYDPDAGDGGLGIAAAMGPMPGGRLGARLVLFPGRRRLVLFTGEEREPAQGRVGGLEMTARRGSLAVRFRGPALLAPDAARHFRSERDQARARVVSLVLDLEAESGEGAGFGAVAGAAEIDGRRVAIETHGFTAVAPSRGAPDGTGAWTRLAASFGRSLGLAIRMCTPAGTLDGERFVASRPERLRQARALSWPRQPRPPEPFAVAVGGDRLACRPRDHLSWLRPLPQSGWARVTLGVAAFELESGERGGGLYEHVERARSASADDSGSAG
jgi:hypothetical protein